MVFNTGAALLDAIVLAVVSKEEEGTYGYKITQDVRKAIEVSESTLYPVLRRLQKDEYLIVYDRECGGRNRRYYQITETGEEKLAEYRSEWESYSSKISELFSGEESEESQRQNGVQSAGIDRGRGLARGGFLHRPRHSERPDRSLPDPRQWHRRTAHCHPQAPARQPHGQELPSGPLRRRRKRRDRRGAEIRGSFQSLPTAYGQAFCLHCRKKPSILVL